MAPKRYDDSGLLADLRPLLGAVPSGDALLREVEAAGAPPGLVVALGGVLRELCASKGGAAPAAEVPSLDGAAAVLPSVSFSSPRFGALAFPALRSVGCSYVSRSCTSENGGVLKHVFL